MPAREPEQPDLEPGATLDHAPSDSFIDRAQLEQVEISEPVSAFARDLSLSMCRLRAGAFAATTLPGLRMVDCDIGRADCSGATWIDTRIVRTCFESCKCTGLDTRGGTLRDVRFHECKMPEAFMQECTLDRVWFESCDLQNLDLCGSTLERVTLRDCDARGLRLLGARITALDLRGSRIDHLTIDTRSVSNIIIDPLQAPALAESLGARVIDRNEEI